MELKEDKLKELKEDKFPLSRITTPLGEMRYQKAKGYYQNPKNGNRGESSFGSTDVMFSFNMS